MIPLSKTEKLVYDLMRGKAPDSVISSQLGIALGTVRVHKSNIRKKGWGDLGSEGKIRDSGCLTGAQESALVLKYSRKLSNSEIARAMQVKPQTVANLLSQSIKKIGARHLVRGARKRAVFIALGIIPTIEPENNAPAMDDPMF